jgi:inositol transport system permease protein
MVAFIGVVVASMLASNVPLPLVLLGGIAIGLASGLISGSVIAFVGTPPFIATLGMMTIARGAAQLYTGGRPISSFYDSFLFIGEGHVGLIPFSAILFVLFGLITHVVLTKTRFGKYIYAIGGNEESAKVCGIRVNRVKCIVYGYCGVMAALGSIIVTSRVDSGNPSSGVGYELDAIAASVIGGTSLMGGVGTIPGTIVGALIIGVLNNGMGLLGISPYTQQIAKGIIIITAVSIDVVRNREKK